MNNDKQLTKICCKFSIISILTFLNYLYYHHHTSKAQTCKHLISEQTLNLVHILNKCTSTKINHKSFCYKNQGLIQRDQAFVASLACAIHIKTFLLLST